MNLQIISIAFMLNSMTNAYNDKMLISNIETLVLNKGDMTTGRRSTPVPQLECLNNCNNIPDIVICKNTGLSDNGDPVWDCQATLSEGIKFTRLDVTCEGYDYPDDPYILKGSCGLSYSLSYKSNNNSYSNNEKGSDDLSGLLLIILIILGLSSCLSEPNYRYDRYDRYNNSPGFWTGAAVGAMGASSYNRRRSTWSSGRNSGFSTSRGFARTSRR